MVVMEAEGDMLFLLLIQTYIHFKIYDTEGVIKQKMVTLVEEVIKPVKMVKM